jgi:HSP20 family protein
MALIETKDSDLALLDQMFGSFLDWQLPNQRYGYFSAPFDLYEKDGKFFLEMGVPGFEPKDISVEVTGGTVTVTGEYKGHLDKKNVRYYRRELPYNSFARTVTLPHDLDPDAVVATIDRGVLRIELMPIKPISPKKIEVKLT